jgi:hypothetical protein
MKEGVCSKGFLKEFRYTTDENVNGYPKYKRREEPTVKRREV